MRTRILSVTPVNPLGVTAPLMNKGSQENGVNAIPCQGIQPLSLFGLFTSRKASSPYTVGFRTPPVADTARKASRCRPQVRERIAEARAENGEGAEIRTQYAVSFTKAKHQKARCEAGFLCVGLFLLFLDSLEQDVLGIGNGVRNAAFLKRNVQVCRRYRRISPPPKAGVI